MDTHFIEEGLVKIEVPDFEKISAKAPVFYNPVMELNRDISVVVLNQYRKSLDHDIVIFDAFGGTGIRGARYSKEIPGVERVLVGDVNPLAVEIARKNMELNDIDNVDVEKNDANVLLQSNKGLFDVVDIDPFGTPSMFTQSTAINIRPGGLICISATDTSALCGTYHDPCLRKYGAQPQKTEYCHENGIRILLAFIARNLAVNQKYMHVLFSHSTEHYMRIYATVKRGGKKTNESLDNIGFIAHCPHCLNRELFHGFVPPVSDFCPGCGEKYVVAGPLWLGHISDKEFIGNMIETTHELELNKRDDLLRLFNQCYDESEGPVTFYDIHKICKSLKISSPKMNDVIDEIRSRGYFISRTHFKLTGMRTDMPLDELKDLIIKIKEEKLGKDV
ncbi:MAG: tRNA (guanine(10)-N(2))-dimethyltransferase [Methanosphaera sp. rholeuAM270]|nr:MAG: tRNA (guanine(10)-N(2))-dimethyltransferase [Methanosphaera sp. rholeuAM270]